ncbi:hypothetical protein NPX13_g6166 [Xylaria arbuscula]|uniref:Uncharacterized protein n=1 Tax=Xylaria arbuscula TaxID=114810 RepID=A0A9W8TLP1_9PEZI|nr:hypothetical protein NPX13_g6166 [Xylaria arbuscula]
MSKAASTKAYNSHSGTTLCSVFTMVARPVARAAVRTARRQSAVASLPNPRTFCTTTPLLRPSTTSSSSSTSTSSSHQNPSNSSSPRTTHFGFQDGLSESEKTERVAGVFHSVAESYDRMNDLMSFGWHRIWKYVVD